MASLELPKHHCRSWRAAALGYAALVMVAGINGGRIFGEQVKVGQANLFQNRDYPVLTDYRAMFSGLFQRMFGLDNAGVQRIFAGVHPAELGLV
jgi:uncharacterized protein (DUF1501 family)